MAQIETWYNQDLQQPVRVHYLDGSLFSHNSNGNRIGVHVFNNGEPVTLTGTVSGYVVTADGSTVPCTGTRSGNSASILIPAAAYQPGAVFITLFITDGTTVTTLASVSTNVLTARTNNQIDPGSVVTDWTQTINTAMQSVETAAENLGGIIAVPYANITYPVPLGKYTYYEGNLYRCISPIATSESFTAAHWTQVRLGDDVSDLKSALGNKVSKPSTLPNGTSGQFLRTNGDGTTTWVDYGMPTDAQTANAVSTWLDNHPEATTTVQDHSLQRIKFTEDLNNQISVVFNTVQEMKENRELHENMYVMTKGFHYVNDGGSAYYEIMKNKNADEKGIISIDGVLYACLIVSSKMNLEAFGAVPMSYDSTIDNASTLSYAISKCEIISSANKIKTSRLNISNINLDGVDLFFPSSASHEYGFTFTNCSIVDSIFSSTNDQQPAWSGGTINESNIEILFSNCNIRNCSFNQVESLTVENSIGVKIEGCTFTDCSSGIVCTESENLIITNCQIKTIKAGSLHHAIYLGANTSDIFINNIIIEDSDYYPLHFYNSNSSKSNPVNITARDIICNGAIDFIAFNGDGLFIDNVVCNTKVTNRYIFGSGNNIVIKNTKINAAYILAIINKCNIEFDNCQIIASGGFTGGSSHNDDPNYLLTVIIKNSILTDLPTISDKRTIQYYSMNNLYITPYTCFSNASDATAIINATFKNDIILNPRGDFFFCYGGSIALFDCFFDCGTRVIIGSRDGNSEYLVSNVTFKESGNHIGSGRKVIFNNVFNEIE